MATATVEPRKKPPESEAMILSSPTPLDLLSVALHNNAAIDVIERLAALQEKAIASDAEMQFNEALNRAQGEIGRVAPDLQNPQTSSRYASYAALDRRIRPVYVKEGFSLSFDTDDCPKADHLRVVCYVSRGRHTRKYKVDMPCDGKGARGGDVMTKTHATGAAMSYGMRYLLKDIFNVAIGEGDTDGNMPSSASGISDDRVHEHCEWMANAKDMDELKRLYRAAYIEANDAKDRAAQSVYIKAKDARKRDLQ